MYLTQVGIHRFGDVILSSYPFGINSEFLTIDQGDQGSIPTGILEPFSSHVNTSK